VVYSLPFARGRSIIICCVARAWRASTARCLQFLPSRESSASRRLPQETTFEVFTRRGASKSRTVRNSDTVYALFYPGSLMASHRVPAIPRSSTWNRSTSTLSGATWMPSSGAKVTAASTACAMSRKRPASPTTSYRAVEARKCARWVQLSTLRSSVPRYRTVRVSLIGEEEHERNG